MVAMMVGWGHGRFGKHPGQTLEELISSVAKEAVAHAGLTGEDIDCAYLGHFNGGLDEQDFTAPLLLQALPGLRFKPVTRIENACASGSGALFAARLAIASGAARTALVVGAEKMTGLSSAQVGAILQRGTYVKEEGGTPGGFAGVFDRITQGYSERFGDPLPAMATIAAKNHANGMANPFAHFRVNLSFEDCNTVSQANPLVGQRLRRSDCAPISDGAAAIVLASAELARGMPRAIGWRGSAHVTDYLPLSRRPVAELPGCAAAWARALQQAGLTLDDLSLVESHDCFSIAELMQYEAMGLAAPGQGSRVALEGITQRTGRLPVNPSGGLKARGHPVGATGVSMHVMAAMQLEQTAGEMQVPGATIAGVFNMGGVAVSNYCSILEAVH